MKDAGQLFPSESLSDQEQSRLQKKLAALRERRIDPFPRAKRNHSIAAEPASCLTMALTEPTVLSKYRQMIWNAYFPKAE